jgi:predicted NAD/FAD-binding protein
LKKIAIIGSGISGLSLAYFLKPYFDVHLYEKNSYLGGHTNTITTSKFGEKVSFDTGFMVFNFKTYPLLTRLFKKLDVKIEKTDMSFSLQNQKTGLEYSGSGFDGLFSQRKNILSLKHYQFLLEVNRFNKQSLKVLQNEKYQFLTIKEFSEKFKFSDYFLENYIIPMSSAVWSTPIDRMLDFPIYTLVRFFYNHGFLGLNTQHQWYTVSNGSFEYVKKIKDFLKNNIYLNSQIKKIKRINNDKVRIDFKDRSSKDFNKVILATHAPTSLKLIDHPTDDEKNLLSKYHYQPNLAVVHTDDKVMPKAKKAWASWNFSYENNDGKFHPTTIYHMNRLQNLKTKHNYYVSINPGNQIDSKKIIQKIEYEHPLFDIDSVVNQNYLSKLNHQGPIYFCGAYFRYGFHEDGLKSGYDLANHLLSHEVDLL